MGINKLLLAQGVDYSLDDIKTGRNNNVLVIGGSGTGKTRSIVTPNILAAEGSYIVSDPKGLLYRECGGYLQRQGYNVKTLNFAQPRLSDKWNPLAYLETPADCLKLAHFFAYGGGLYTDVFWNEQSELLTSALLGYLLEKPEEMRTLSNYARLVEGLQRAEYGSDSSATQKMIEMLPPMHWARRQFELAALASTRTWLSIAATMAAQARIFSLPEISEMTYADDMRLDEIGSRKTALFVIVSDTDRSMDWLAIIFFAQAMRTLVETADKQGGRLEVPVRLILDDFATNCKVPDFPGLISSIRSRGVSAMVMIQAEAQLATLYGRDWRTVEGNCDTIVYLGGADIQTAQSVSTRANRDLQDILNMPARHCWIFRRGEEPREADLLELDAWIQQKGVELEPRGLGGSDWFREAMNFSTDGGGT